MQLKYYPDTDTLYIALRDGTGVESEEVGPGIVMDFDEAGEVLGIEVEDASGRVDLSSFQAFSLPEAKVSAPSG